MSDAIHGNDRDEGRRYIWLFGLGGRGDIVDAEFG